MLQTSCVYQASACWGAPEVEGACTPLFMCVWKMELQHVHYSCWSMKVFLLHPASAVYENIVNFQLVDNAVVPRVAQTLAATLVCHWGNLIDYFLSKNYFITVSCCA